MDDQEKKDNQINENQKNNDLNICKNELQTMKDSFIRLGADFENYKKRVSKEKNEWLTSCQSEIIIDLLNIVDDFDRAFNELNKSEVKKESQNWISGFELIHKSLYKFLNKYGVQEIENNKNFDPEIHEAIAQIESQQHKSGEIVNIAQKGFTLKDRILRPAKVIVAK